MKEHLVKGGRLEEHIKQFNGLVKLYHNDRREGLIRARSIGARQSVGSVLVYLDAHCEVEPNWLPPLIQPMVHGMSLTHMIHLLIIFFGFWSPDSRLKYEFRL